VVGKIMENTENEDTTIVWHYTKMGVLENIFKLENQDSIEFRFTNDKFSKDPSEGLVLRKFTKTNMNNILENLNADLKRKVNEEQTKKKRIYSFFPYVFSTTRLKDSFAFWNKEYAGWDGVSIGIKLELIKKDKDDKLLLSSDVHYINPDLIIKQKDDLLIKKVAKEFSESYKLYPHIKEIYPNVCAIDIFLELFSNMYKHKSWEYENEVRIMLNGEIKKIKEEFNENKIKKVYYKKFNKNVIYSIILGPACNDEEVDAVKKYLKKNGYDIPVSRSHAFDLKDRNF
jgi:hypothetical protein